MMERSKWEVFKDDVAMWIELGWMAAICGLAYGLGKNICDRLFR